MHYMLNYTSPTAALKTINDLKVLVMNYKSMVGKTEKASPAVKMEENASWIMQMLWWGLILWAATKGSVTCFQKGIHFSSVIFQFYFSLPPSL